MVSIVATMLTMILWKFTVFPCKFDSPQVKLDLISSITNFIYKLPHELVNDLRSWEIRKKQEKIKIWWGHNLVSSLHSRNHFLTITVRIWAKVFLSRPTLFDSFTFCHIFCPRL